MTDKKTDTADKAEPLVNVKRENYVTARTASGTKSLHNDDIVANGLQGLTLDELYPIFGKFSKFPMKVKGTKCENVDEVMKIYSSLNVGMQRMNIGNRMRGRVAQIDKENIAAATKAKADGKEPKEALSGVDKLAKVLAPAIKLRDKRVAEAAKAKKAADKEAAKKEAA